MIFQRMENKCSWRQNYVLQSKNFVGPVQVTRGCVFKREPNVEDVTDQGHSDLAPQEWMCLSSFQRGGLVTFAEDF